MKNTPKTIEEMRRRYWQGEAKAAKEQADAAMREEAALRGVSVAEMEKIADDECDANL